MNFTETERKLITDALAGVPERVAVYDYCLKTPDFNGARRALGSLLHRFLATTQGERIGVADLSSNEQRMLGVLVTLTELPDYLSHFHGDSRYLKAQYSLRKRLGLTEERPDTSSTFARTPDIQQ